MNSSFITSRPGFISDCDDLIAPLYGSLSSNRVSHGNIVTVSCNKGYTLLGERTIACTSGSLSSSIGTCETGTVNAFLFLNAHFYINLN